jgi:hypothetical protein
VIHYWILALRQLDIFQSLNPPATCLLMNLVSTVILERSEGSISTLLTDSLSCLLLTNLNFKSIISNHCHSGLDPLNLRYCEQRTRATLEKFWTPDQVRGDKTEKFVADMSQIYLCKNSERNMAGIVIECISIH